MKATKTVIEPASGFSLRLHELWQYRELFYIFTWRDIKVKYKQTTLGILWAVLQPLSLLLLFVLVFSKGLRFQPVDLPYPIFILSGLILWNLFYSSVSTASESILQHGDMIKKIYFPRLIIPVSSVLAACFDFFIGLLVFLVFCFIYKSKPDLTILYLFPAAFFLTVVAALGTGIFFSALTIRYRDFRYVIPFTLQFLFFATQVVYALDGLKQAVFKNLLALNPLNGAIEILRGSFTGRFDTTVIFISLAATLFISFTGFYFFKKTEANFADLA